jgi:hypothetical protein
MGQVIAHMDLEVGAMFYSHLQQRCKTYGRVNPYRKDR